MLEEENGVDPRLQAISAAIRVVPHFPKPGSFFLLCSLSLSFGFGSVFVLIEMLPIFSMLSGFFFFFCMWVGENRDHVQRHHHASAPPKSVQRRG